MAEKEIKIDDLPDLAVSMIVDDESQQLQMQAKKLAADNKDLSDCNQKLTDECE